MEGRRVFIWDLDGTLLDSYAVIVSSLYEVYKEYGAEFGYDEIHEYAIRTSVNDFIRMAEEKTGISYETIRDRYMEIRYAKTDTIQPVPQAKETLEKLRASGAEHFVFTHRGETTIPVLTRLGLLPYFTEVINSERGFPRKPDPAALNYLAEKYGLDRKNTFYVGDRTLDMQCAEAAGMQGILYLPEGSYCKPDGTESFIVRSLWEITKK